MRAARSFFFSPGNSKRNQEYIPKDMYTQVVQLESPISNVIIRCFPIISEVRVVVPPHTHPYSIQVCTAQGYHDPRNTPEYSYIIKAGTAAAKVTNRMRKRTP